MLIIVDAAAVVVVEESVLNPLFIYDP